MKRCPICAEQIQDAAILCPYCHSNQAWFQRVPGWMAVLAIGGMLAVIVWMFIVHPEWLS